MDAGGWSSSKAAQRYIHMHDEALKEASKRLSTVKPVRSTHEITATSACELAMPYPSHGVVADRSPSKADD